MAVFVGDGLARDVNPVDSSAVTLPNELVEGRVVHYPFHPLLAQDNGRDVDVAGFSRQVLRCLAATDGIVECRTAVTGTDDYGLTGMVAQWLEYVLAECLEVPYYGLVCFHRGVETVVDAVGLGCGRTYELCQRKMWGKFHFIVFLLLNTM